MDYPTTPKAAQASHPLAYAQALARLRASRSVKRAAPESQLSWKWSLGVRIEAMNGNQMLGMLLGGKAPAPSLPQVDETLRVSDPQAYCDQMIDAGNFLLTLVCEKAFASDNLGAGQKAPSEVVSAWSEAPLAAPDPSERLLHLHQPHAKLPGIHQSIVRGAYLRHGVVRVVDESNMLHTLDPVAGTAAFAGGFQPAARAAFSACPPGAQFRYRGSKMRKLTEAELDAVLNYRAVWLDGGLDFGMAPAFAAPPGAPASSDPVYPPGAASHSDPQPLGRADALGLVPSLAPAKRRAP